MLNRLVEHFYWLGSYMERAENQTRLLRTFYQLQSMPNHQGEFVKQVLANIVFDHPVNEPPCLYTSAGMHDYFFNLQVTNSLYFSIKCARTNLFAVRHRMPSEVWDMLNGVYLEMSTTTISDILDQTPDRYLRELSHKFLAINGMICQQMLQDSEWEMYEVGRTMERIENVLRLHRIMLISCENENYGEWCWRGILDSIGSVEAYRSSSMDGFRFDSVASFLFLNEKYPKSVNRSVTKLDQHLRKLLLEESDVSFMQPRGMRVIEQLRALLALVEFDGITKVEALQWIDQFNLITNKLSAVLQRDWVIEGVVA